MLWHLFSLLICILIPIVNTFYSSLLSAQMWRYQDFPPHDSTTFFSSYNSHREKSISHWITFASLPFFFSRTRTISSQRCGKQSMNVYLNRFSLTPFIAPKHLSMNVHLQCFLHSLFTSFYTLNSAPPFTAVLQWDAKEEGMSEMCALKSLCNEEEGGEEHYINRVHAYD